MLQVLIALALPVQVLATVMSTFQVPVNPLQLLGISRPRLRVAQDLIVAYAAIGTLLPVA